MATAVSLPISSPALEHALVDPRRDPEWASFAHRHPRAGVFHQPEWARALCENFGYQPRYHVLANRAGRIEAAWPSMLVKSRLTGSRLVCLPFCHIAGPLASDEGQALRLFEAVREDARSLGAPTVESRGWPSGIRAPHAMTRVDHYSLHLLDLTGGAEEVMKRLDKDIRYSIRRAQRDGVTTRVAEGGHDLKIFYDLYLQLRRRQGLLPQPATFIRAVYREFVETGNGFIVIAEAGGSPVSALLTICHGIGAVGTHAGAALSGRQMRATPLAMWASIELACRRGHTSYDFGRSDAESPGLQQFKEHWGASRVDIPYYFSPEPSGVNAGSQTGIKRTAMAMFSRWAPQPAFALAGSRLYRHLG